MQTAFKKNKINSAKAEVACFYETESEWDSPFLTRSFHRSESAGRQKKAGTLLPSHRPVRPVPTSPLPCYNPDGITARRAENGGGREKRHAVNKTSSKITFGTYPLVFFSIIQYLSRFYGATKTNGR